ncbi:MAG TPA: asparagine synthase (glutamine-hydrolyzing) [Tepidisphaeraceae bacterium]|nr:asparagine synthase (glutamine-hydrolyzing) [Tepidisphaeraceae bacterium]
MCGFAGVVAFDHTRAVSREVLMRMSACIAHRGPDGEGIWISPEHSPGPRVALAHRRLAILDLDPRSNQPFTNGRHWLVFNGEIYNFRELRHELYRYDWKTTGDTEVILAAYEKWGTDCVKHLNGMYALAIWSPARDGLFLARDRMGQKPLMVAVKAGENGRIDAVAFASEVGALLPVEWVDRTIDTQSLVEYLRWGYSRGRTMFRGIQSVLPSQTLTVTECGVEGADYSDLKPAAVAADKLVLHTGDLIEKAVRRQLVSDVEVGCFLSGGMDSSVIASLAAPAFPKKRPLRTFSIAFDDPRYDESKYAAEVAFRLGTNHQSFVVRPDAANDLPLLAAAFGEPIADSSALATHYLARETRKYVKVALSGDGGDELFGGYDRYRALRIIRASGPRLWKLVSPMAALLPGSHPKSLASGLRRLARSAVLPEAERYASYMRLMDESLLGDLLGSEPSGSDLIDEQFTLARQSRQTVEAALAVDRQTYLPEDVLVKVDRCSMLHALEVRSPFLDHELVAFAAGLSEADLLGSGSKSLLRKAFDTDLPANVFRRKKMGFAVPIGDWLRTSLRPMLHDSLFAADSFVADHFNRPTVERMIADHHEKRVDHSQRLYALLMLELWWRGVRG